MDSLTAARQELKSLLDEAGVEVITSIPERLAPPAVFLAAGSPYLEPGARFGTFIHRFTLVLVVATGPNTATTPALDALAAKVVVGLHSANRWDVERVDQPQMLQANNTQFYSTTIDVASTREVED